MALDTCTLYFESVDCLHEQKIVFLAGIGTCPDFTWLEGEETYSGTIHDFINTHTLSEERDSDTEDDLYDRISKNPISPLTRVMVMIGC